MANRWHKCSSKKNHRTEAEAKACPGCLKTLPAPTRQRRNAVVASMLPGRPHLDPASPATSWETISSTPESSGAASPAGTPKGAGAGYPTPSFSQSIPQHYPQGRRGAISGSPGTPSKTTFTTQRELPDPSTAANEDSVWYSHDLLGNLQTTSFSPTSRRDSTSSHLILSPPPLPMALRKRHNTRSAIRAPSILLPETRSSVSPTTSADIAIPSIETLPNPPNTPGHDHGHDYDLVHHLATLRTSHLNLTRQLQDSTALVERLRTRANLANIERDHAVAGREAAQAELVTVQRERNAAHGGRWACRICLQFLVAIAVSYLVYRFMLYEPEFEYIWRRSMVVLGLEE